MDELIKLQSGFPRDLRIDFSYKYDMLLPEIFKGGVEKKPFLFVVLWLLWLLFVLETGV